MTSRIIALITILIAFSNITFAQKTNKITLDKNVSIKLPSSYTIMSDDDIASRYPSYRKPIAMYISDDRMADFGYNVSNGVWGNDIELLRKVYKSTIMNNFNKVTFINDTIVTFKKRKYILFEYISEVSDENNASGQKKSIKTYTNSKYALQNGEIYIFNFNCPEKLKEKFQLQANQILSTVKINLIPNNHKATVIEPNSKNPNLKKKPENPYQKNK